MFNNQGHAVVWPDKAISSLSREIESYCDLWILLFKVDINIVRAYKRMNGERLSITVLFHLETNISFACVSVEYSGFLFLIEISTICPRKLFLHHIPAIFNSYLSNV